MILIADSGSTHTDWAVIKDKQVKFSFNTKGINPYFTTSHKLQEELESELPGEINPAQVATIYFYGAGCSSTENKSIVLKGLQPLFTQAKIEVNHDLLGAARALFKQEPGITIILGTGASTCLYDGKEITQNVPSLGYILGDEGGGDHLGKLFMAELLYGTPPQNIKAAFLDTYQLSEGQIMQKIYKGEHPNRFLASTCEFIYKHRNNHFMIQLIHQSFDALFEKHITQYKGYQDYKIKAVGSIAYYFFPFLNEVAMKFNTKVDEVEKKPIMKLAEYHLS